MNFSDRSQDELFNLVANFQDETELPMTSEELRELSFMMQGMISQSLKMRLRMQSIQRPLSASHRGGMNDEPNRPTQKTLPGLDLDEQEGNVTSKSN